MSTITQTRVDMQSLAVELASQVAEFTNEPIQAIVDAACVGTTSIYGLVDNVQTMLTEQIELFIDENPELFVNDGEVYPTPMRRR